MAGDASFGMDAGVLPNSVRRSRSVSSRKILYPRILDNSFWPSLGLGHSCVGRALKTRGF